MKQCMTILAFLLASTLCGCSVLPGSAADPGSPAAKLQTVLRGHPDKIFNTLVVTEYNGVLQVRGFVNTFKQRNAVEAMIRNHAVSGDLDFAGRIVNSVVLYADYDCHANDECFVQDKCFGDVRCLTENGCNTFDECL